MQGSHLIAGFLKLDNTFGKMNSRLILPAQLFIPAVFAMLLEGIIILKTFNVGFVSYIENFKWLLLAAESASSIYNGLALSSLFDNRPTSISSLPDI